LQRRQCRANSSGKCSRAMLVTFSGCGAAIGTLRGSAPEAAREKCLSLALRSGTQIVSSSARCCAEAATLINAPLVVSSHFSILLPVRAVCLIARGRGDEVGRPFDEKSLSKEPVLFACPFSRNLGPAKRCDPKGASGPIVAHRATVNRPANRGGTLSPGSGRSHLPLRRLVLDGRVPERVQCRIRRHDHSCRDWSGPRHPPRPGVHAPNGGIQSPLSMRQDRFPTGTLGLISARANDLNRHTFVVMTFA
jgi:hypothetical protein